ncbi:hypothetical protein IWQ62_003460 [Dispira parvispora]|uniref:Uncharacterized protein n=1 Tax=Dispira parvispora TaxID=1520584 RepID=A0A9W8ANF7_9FUNG|nr:hypothetical protein IWQ62_003460 [Dispira parvispora]
MSNNVVNNDPPTALPPQHGDSTSNTGVYYVSIGPEAVKLEALEADVQLLMKQYLATHSIVFQPYLDIWEGINVSLVHFTCMDKAGRGNFMRTLYRLIQDYFTPELETQCAVLYALYMVYMTQPRLFDKVAIPVDLDQMRKWDGFFNVCLEQDLEDAVYIYNHLLDQEAFQLCAFVNPVPGFVVTQGDQDQRQIRRKVQELGRQVLATDNLQRILKLEGDGSTDTATERTQSGTISLPSSPESINTVVENWQNPKLNQLSHDYTELKRRLMNTPEAHTALAQLHSLVAGGDTTHQIGSETEAIGQGESSTRGNDFFAMSGVMLSTDQDILVHQTKSYIQDYLQERAQRQATYNLDESLFSNV